MKKSAKRLYWNLFWAILVLSALLMATAAPWDWGVP
jgi:hypothetical protein